MIGGKLQAVHPVLPTRDVREFAFFDPDRNGLTFYCDLRPVSG